MEKIVYLTGAPATGKSTLAKLLRDRLPHLQVWEYGARLTEYLNAQGEVQQTQEDIRDKSARVVTAADVEAVDRQLIRFVAASRGSHPVIIDSHAVTKEHFGFRAIPFSTDLLREVSPDEIWVLIALPETLVMRIANAPAGRPQISEHEARLHMDLQASVALAYGAALGRPVYLFNTDDPNRESLVDLLSGRLS